MVPGKSTCNQLKAIRKCIADANNIPYTPIECHHEGPCRGTCPACEAEVRYIESQLQHRRSLGKGVVIVGLAAGVSLAACTSNTSTSVETSEVHVSEAHGASPEEPKPEVPAPDTDIDTISVPANCLKKKAEPETIEDLEGDVVLPDDDFEFESVEQPFVGPVVESLAEFPGGLANYRKFIASQVRYPDIALENCIQGRVYVSYVVSADGSVTDVKALRSVDPSLDKAAVEVISMMPKWEPASIGGVKTESRYLQPFVFRLWNESDTTSAQSDCGFGYSYNQEGDSVCIELEEMLVLGMCYKPMAPMLMGEVYVVEEPKGIRGFFKRLIRRIRERREARKNED